MAGMKRYIDNSNLAEIDLQVLKRAVTIWKKAQMIPEVTRSTLIDPSPEIALTISNNHPILYDDVIRLTQFERPYLAFYGYLTALLIDKERAESESKLSPDRTFAIHSGSFQYKVNLQGAVDSALRHIQFYTRQTID